jgi:hypothetical protein
MILVVNIPLLSETFPMKWILWPFLCLSCCLALPLASPPTYRLYNSTLLELNTTTSLDLNATVVGLVCNGNSSMNLTALDPQSNATSTLFSVDGCLVPLGVRVFTSDQDLWTVLASSDPGPACFPPPTCEEYVFSSFSNSKMKTEIPTVNKTFFDLDPTQQATVILLSLIGAMVVGVISAVVWRGCCFECHKHRNRFIKL